MQTKKTAGKKTKSKAKTKYAIGVDLGGTNVVIVLVNTAGKIKLMRRFPTEAAKGPDHVIKNIADNVLILIKEAGVNKSSVLALGIGAPGPLDSKTGVVFVAPNLPGWKNIKLKAKLERYTGIKTGVENDANCAVYGEKWIGAAKNASSVVGFTLGTGVGGGIIINDKLLRGVSNTAGELGHTIVEVDGRKCGCGAKGCLESYASASAIAKSAKDRIKKGRKSQITEIVRGNLNKVTSKTVFDAMRTNDKTALETWAEFIKYLSVGIASTINALNPEVIVISGGVINAGNKLFKPLREETGRIAFAAPFAAVKIVPAKLGETAGALGAAGVVINEGESYGI